MNLLDATVDGDHVVSAGLRLPVRSGTAARQNCCSGRRRRTSGSAREIMTDIE
jgi:hypothetical protein